MNVVSRIVMRFLDNFRPINHFLAGLGVTFVGGTLLGAGSYLLNQWQIMNSWHITNVKIRDFADVPKHVCNDGCRTTEEEEEDVVPIANDDDTDSEDEAASFEQINIGPVIILLDRENTKS